MQRTQRQESREVFSPDGALGGALAGGISGGLSGESFGSVVAGALVGMVAGSIRAAESTRNPRESVVVGANAGAEAGAIAGFVTSIVQDMCEDNPGEKKEESSNAFYALTKMLLETNGPNLVEPPGTVFHRRTSRMPFSTSTNNSQKIFKNINGDHFENPWRRQLLAAQLFNEKNSTSRNSSLRKEELFWESSYRGDSKLPLSRSYCSETVTNGIPQIKGFSPKRGMEKKEWMTKRCWVIYMTLIVVLGIFMTLYFY